MVPEITCRVSERVAGCPTFRGFEVACPERSRRVGAGPPFRSKKDSLGTLGDQWEAASLSASSSSLVTVFQFLAVAGVPRVCPMRAQGNFERPMPLGK